MTDIREVLDRVRARVRRGQPINAGQAGVLLAEIDRLDEVLAAVCRGPEPVATDDQLAEQAGTGVRPAGADQLIAVLADWAAEAQGGEPR